MIHKLRFIERDIVVESHDCDYQTVEKVRVLQAYDGAVWYDVPLETKPAKTEL